jgi:hypothetical protein
MPRFSDNEGNSSNSKRHFTLVKGNKEHGLFYGSTPSAAALMVATKLFTSSKSKKSDIVEFNIKEITQDSKKKVYGPYIGYIDKVPNKLKNKSVKSYKIVAKLKKVGMKGGSDIDQIEIDYGDCGKMHFYSRKTASNKCIILYIGIKKITIGRHGESDIQVKYFTNNSSIYYKKEIYLLNDKINIKIFDYIISNLLGITSTEHQLLQLISRILVFIDSISSPEVDIPLIRKWFEDAKIKSASASAANSQYSAPPPPAPPPPAPPSAPPPPTPPPLPSLQLQPSSSASRPGYLGNIANAARLAEERRLRREAAEAIGSEAAVKSETSTPNLFAELKQKQLQKKLQQPVNMSRLNALKINKKEVPQNNRVLTVKERVALAHKLSSNRK